jgi:hypothetical protein
MTPYDENCANLKGMISLKYVNGYFPLQAIQNDNPKMELEIPLLNPTVAVSLLFVVAFVEI